MLSALLPRRFYTYGDDRLYSLYQRLILCCFNTYTGVDVSVYFVLDGIDIEGSV